MRTLLFILAAASAAGQCPTATNVFTSTCKSTPEGYYNQEVTIRPVITNTTSAVIYSWSATPGTLYSGGDTPNTIKTSAAGVYTLTMIDGTCNVVTTHTVENCAPGIPMVEIEEHEADPSARIYFDLYGNITELKQGLLIEQVGTRRKKILVQ